MELPGTLRINERGQLELGGIEVTALAAAFGTPLYLYDEALIRDNCRKFCQAFRVKEGWSQVLYAGKAFLTTAMCRIVHSEGLGLDVVSGGEIYTAIEAGFPASKIYFHGNNKTYEEICLALEAGVGHFVVDNFMELETLSRLSAERGKRTPVLLRIAPGIEAHTHRYIQTGQEGSKFGFPLAQALAAARRAKELPGIEYRGLHCHLGSQIMEINPYQQTLSLLMDLARAIKGNTGLVTQQLNLGGGFGIRYTPEDRPPSPALWGETLLACLEEESRKNKLPRPLLLVEPGRAIIGPAGHTAYRVGTIKEVPGGRKYVAVDGGMADNIRPALYQAKYMAVLANKAALPPSEEVTIVGKCCETGDVLIENIALPPVEPGDILVVLNTGAYSYSMASNYNRLPRPAGVLVNQGRAFLILKREDYKDLLRQDLIPPHLALK